MIVGAGLVPARLAGDHKGRPYRSPRPRHQRPGYVGRDAANSQMATPTVHPIMCFIVSNPSCNNIKMRFKCLPIVATTVILTVSGVGQVQPKLSGFLNEYPPLSPLEGVPDTLFWRVPEVERKYRAVLVAQLEIFLDPKSAYKGIQPDAFELLADALKDVVATNVAERRPLATEPGPDVVRLRIALSNLFLKKGGTFAWHQAIGPGSAYTMQAAIGRNVSLVEGVLEIEATDSSTGRRLGFVGTQVGQHRIKEIGVPERKGSWADLVRRFHDQVERGEGHFTFLWEQGSGR